MEPKHPPPALLKNKYKKVIDMASKLRMHKVQRVSHLFEADDISGKSVSNMNMRIKAEFNCKNTLNERGENVMSLLRNSSLLVLYQNGLPCQY